MPPPPLAPSNTQRPLQRSKPRNAAKVEPPASHTHFSTIPSTSVFDLVPESFTPFNTLSSFPEIPAVPAVGSKRRHAMMMMLDATVPPNTPGVMPQTPSLGGAPVAPTSHLGSGRRKIRNGRGQQQQPQNQNINLLPSTEAMDIEDDGRERKRVARR